jgi:hypothetical protein
MNSAGGGKNKIITSLDRVYRKVAKIKELPVFTEIKQA